MIRSLTGFGDVDISNDAIQLNITIRTVNSRFMDIKIRGIELNPRLEMKIRKEIQKSLLRGNVQIQISNRSGKMDNNTIKFDQKRYEQIDDIIRTIQQNYGRRLELGNLISLNDIIAGTDLSDISDSVLLQGVINALEQVDKMRREEGEAISKDIISRISFVQNSLQQLEKLSKEFVTQQNSKYKEKIKSLLNDITVDEDRLAQEIAINADRFDFTEEIVRSISHCEQFSKFLKIEEPVGKKMNFILQELSREINTIGSKSPSNSVSQVVIELKSEIEKIREQVQNIL